MMVVVVDCIVLIATSEGSFSEALKSDLLAGGVVVGGGAAVAVDVVAAAAAVDGVVGVWACCWPLLLFSEADSASLSSCWYMSSTMGFHNRTLAFMNQFDT